NLPTLLPMALAHGVRQRDEEAGARDDRGDASLGNDLGLQFMIADTARYHGGADGLRGRVEQQSRGNEMVRPGIENDVARPDTRRAEEHVEIVGTITREGWLEDRSRRDVDPLQRSRIRREEAAER